MRSAYSRATVCMIPWQFASRKPDWSAYAAAVIPSTAASGSAAPLTIAASSRGVAGAALVLDQAGARVQVAGRLLGPAEAGVRSLARGSLLVAAAGQQQHAEADRDEHDDGAEPGEQRAAVHEAGAGLRQRLGPAEPGRDLRVGHADAGVQVAQQRAAAPSSRSTRTSPRPCPRARRTSTSGVGRADRRRARARPRGCSTRGRRRPRACAQTLKLPPVATRCGVVAALRRPTQHRAGGEQHAEQDQRRVGDEKDSGKTSSSVVGGRGQLSSPKVACLADHPPAGAGGWSARTVAPYGFVVESVNVSVLLYVPVRRASPAPMACLKATVTGSLLTGPA